MLSQTQIKNARMTLDNKVSDYMLPVDGRMLAQDASVGDAATKFLSPETNIIFVVDDENHRQLKGIVTRSDMRQAQRKALSTTEKILDYASRRVVLLRDESLIGDAVKVFYGNNPMHLKVDYIPIVDASNVLKGYLDATGLLPRITQ
jgi:predicted transcriptional regulator